MCRMKTTGNNSLELISFSFSAADVPHYDEIITASRIEDLFVAIPCQRCDCIWKYEAIWEFGTKRLLVWALSLLTRFGWLSTIRRTVTWPPWSPTKTNGRSMTSAVQLWSTRNCPILAELSEQCQTTDLSREQLKISSAESANPRPEIGPAWTDHFRASFILLKSSATVNS